MIPGEVHAACYLAYYLDHTRDNMHTSSRTEFNLYDIKKLPYKPENIDSGDFQHRSAGETTNRPTTDYFLT